VTKRLTVSSHGYAEFADAGHAAKALAAKDGADLDGSTLIVGIALLPFGPDLMVGYGISPREFASLPPIATSDLSSTTKSTLEPQPPPFDHIAEVFIDGRTKAEIRSIIYLDPSNIFFSKAPALLPGRRVRSQS
jgi:hypothetical protein